MGSLREFLRQFFSNSGQFVFLSLLAAKICAFLSALYIIRLLPQAEFGTLTIVASVFAVFAPFSGFGSQQSLLRYGSLGDDLENKKLLSRHLFFEGLRYQLMLSVAFIAVSLFFVSRYDDIFYIFCFFTVRLIGFYFFNHIQSELRILGRNKLFARVNNVVNIGGFLLLLLLTPPFGLTGYLVAMAVSPFLALFWYRRDHLHKLPLPKYPKRELRWYGLHASGSALLSDMLFSADILLLSFFLNEIAVAEYKAAILLPANITFLALTFMQSDFPTLAKNHQNREFLKSYIGNYYKLFLPLAVIIFATGFLLDTEILHFFFKERYSDNGLAFTILLAAFCANLLLRNLYGNLLSAVGKMKINTAVSAATLCFLAVFAFLCVPAYGVAGMAAALAVSMFLNGVLLSATFYLYFKNLN